MTSTQGLLIKSGENHCQLGEGSCFPRSNAHPPHPHRRRRRRTTGDLG
jgi:hypothetical protein